MLAERQCLERVSIKRPCQSWLPDTQGLRWSAVIRRCTIQLFLMENKNSLAAVFCKHRFLSSTSSPLKISLLCRAARNGKKIGFQNTRILKRQGKSYGCEDCSVRIDNCTYCKPFSAHSHAMGLEEYWPVQSSLSITMCCIK